MRKLLIVLGVLACALSTASAQTKKSSNAVPSSEAPSNTGTGPWAKSMYAGKYPGRGKTRTWNNPHGCGTRAFSAGWC
jgi:hypothetical protein